MKDTTANAYLLIILTIVLFWGEPGIAESLRVMVANAAGVKP